MPRDNFQVIWETCQFKLLSSPLLSSIWFTFLNYSIVIKQKQSICAFVLAREPKWISSSLRLIISTKSNKSNLPGRADIQVYIRRQKERGVKINAIFKEFCWHAFLRSAWYYVNMHFKNKRGSGFDVLCPMVSIAKPQKAFLYEVWAPAYVHFNDCLCQLYRFIKFPNKSLQFWLQGQGGCSVPGPILCWPEEELPREQRKRCLLWAMGPREQPAIWFHWSQLCNLRLRSPSYSLHREASFLKC